MNYTNGKIFCAGAVVLISILAQSYGGKEFYVGFFDMFAPLSITTRVYISNPNSRAAYIKLSTPRLSPTDPGYVWDRRYIMPYSSISVGLPIALIQTGSQKSNKVLYVIASQDVSVQAFISDYMISGSYSALPKSFLDNQYLITTFYYDDPLNNRPIGFIIMGTEDNTKVSIKLGQAEIGNLSVTYNSTQYTTGNVIEDTIHAYEALEIQVDSRTGAGLSGTLITSDKPIAVLIGTKQIQILGNTIDHLLDIVLPIDSLGSEYYFMSTPNRTDGNYVRITGIHNGTLYSITDETGNLTAKGYVDAYSTTQIFIPGTHSYYINASNPIQAALAGLSCHPNTIINQNGDPYLLLLRPMSYGFDEYVLTTMKARYQTYNNYLTIIAPTSDLYNLLVNGTPVELSDWKNFSATGISIKTVQLLSSALLTYIIRSSTGGKFQAYVTEMTDRETTAMYLLNARVSYIDANQGLFKKMIEGIGVASSFGCLPSLSKGQCTQYCAKKRTTCAGIHYNTATKACCLLTDNDIINGERYNSSQSQFYQWTEDADIYPIILEL